MFLRRNTHSRNPTNSKCHEYHFSSLAEIRAARRYAWYIRVSTRIVCTSYTTAAVVDVFTLNLSTQRRQQYAQCPSWFLIEVLWLQTVSQTVVTWLWDRERPKNNSEFIKVRTRTVVGKSNANVPGTRESTTNTPTKKIRTTNKTNKTKGILRWGRIQMQIKLSYYTDDSFCSILFDFV